MLNTSDNHGADIYNEVIKLFDGKKSPFHTMLWFASKNSWLDGKSPAECILHRDNFKVVLAAKMEVYNNNFG